MARQIDFAVHHLNRYLSEKGAEAVGPAAAVGRWRDELIRRVFSDLCVDCGVVAVDE